MHQRRRRKLGEILLEQELITEEQLLYALKEHKFTGVNLGTILVNKGFISEEELSSVLGEQIQMNTKKRLGEVLMDNKLITQEQLDEALNYQKQNGKKLGVCLTELGFIKQGKLLDVLSAQLDIQRVRLDGFNFKPHFSKIFPKEMCTRYKAVPLYEKNGILTLAMVDPTNLRTVDHFKFKSGKEIEPVMASEKEIMAGIEKMYGNELEEMADAMSEAEGTSEDLEVVEDDEGEELTDEEGAQVVKIVNLMVTKGIQEGASDIHLEPMETHYRLRYRIDGELVEQNPIPLQLRAQIVSRIKIMAGMDIAEKRKPQDGQFQIRYEGRQVDLRVSTFPSMTRNRGANEKIVMRIIDQESNSLPFEEMGFRKSTLETFQKMIKLPDGIILVTGPTGSGKSTTLYAALRSINKYYQNKKNIVTMEDPVESSVEGINQGQMNPKAGFNFASGMRSILRQDPDIIMVGEMRDFETCQMAVQAALTGHVVFSTLHTNDAPGSFTRLLDMGLAPYLIASTIRAILAQRLARRICKTCKEEYTPEESILKELGLKTDTKFYRGKGCSRCKHTGYRGRVGLFELLVKDEKVERMVINRASSDEIKHYCIENGLLETLRMDGLKKALAGVTTLEQVFGLTMAD